VLAQLVLYLNKHEGKMHFANCRALAAVLFTTLIENLSLCSSAEFEIALNLFLNLSKNKPSVFIKFFFEK